MAAFAAEVRLSGAGASELRAHAAGARTPKWGGSESQGSGRSCVFGFLHYFVLPV